MAITFQEALLAAQHDHNIIDEAIKPQYRNKNQGWTGKCCMSHDLPVWIFLGPGLKNAGAL